MHRTDRNYDCTIAGKYSNRSYPSSMILSRFYSNNFRLLAGGHFIVFDRSVRVRVVTSQHSSFETCACAVLYADSVRKFRQPIDVRSRAFFLRIRVVKPCTDSVRAIVVRNSSVGILCQYYNCTFIVLLLFSIDLFTCIKLTCRVRR